MSEWLSLPTIPRRSDTRDGFKVSEIFDTDAFGKRRFSLDPNNSTVPDYPESMRLNLFSIMVCVEIEPMGSNASPKAIFST